MNTINDWILRTIAHEGGFTNNPNDRGNWTGGKIGVGVLKGTNFGISAESYPDLDIVNLTQAQAIAIYLKDYWEPGLNLLTSQQAAWKIFDIGVNFGQSVGVKVLQTVVKVAVDGSLGNATAAAANAIPELQLLISIGKEEARRHVADVVANPADLQFLGNWIARSFDLGF